MTDLGLVNTRRVPGEFNLADHLTMEEAWQQLSGSEPSMPAVDNGLCTRA